MSVSPQETSHTKRTNEDGFVLLSVLLVTAVISALTLSAMITLRAHARSNHTEAQLIKARTLADAGITRVMAAIENQDDPFLAQRYLRQEKRWRYGGADIVMTVVPETGRVDLNAGHPELVSHVIRGVVKDQALAEQLIRRWAARRNVGDPFDNVGALLLPQERFTPLAAELEEAFTTVSAAQGIDPLAAPDVVLRHVPGLTDADRILIADARQGLRLSEFTALKNRLRPLLDSERPLYRVISMAALPNEIVTRREALVALNRETGDIRIVFWRDRMRVTPL